MERSAAVLQSLFGSVELHREFTLKWLLPLPLLNVLSKSEPPDWMPELFSYFFKLYVSTIWKTKPKLRISNKINRFVITRRPKTNSIWSNKCVYALNMRLARIFVEFACVFSRRKWWKWPQWHRLGWQPADYVWSHRMCTEALQQCPLSWVVAVVAVFIFILSFCFAYISQLLLSTTTVTHTHTNGCVQFHFRYRLLALLGQTELILSLIAVH